ncbi:unnamed protein product [Caenorhabditis bovis]|uniref:Protein kinase domain-containing protein n=1 Tax=Caenorhabditis bovis TaxID=2654633 RepID=A0A8S1EJM4_9PELO|nr:unnamed protein product [Caenorhabditis bovis]
MSSLYPDESYCTSEIGRILFQSKSDWACSAAITSCDNEKGITGQYTIYQVKIECKPVSGTLVNYGERTFLLSTRFKEMQKLHTACAKLHKQLYLRGIFPSFPAAKLIGSLEPSVIHERKLAIEQLLNVILESEVLRKTRVLQEFVERAQEKVTASHEVTPGMIHYDQSRSIIDTPITPETSDAQISDESTSVSNQETTRQEFEFPEVRIDPSNSTSHDFLIRAGQLVSTAQRAEEEQAYELAFQCYKNAASCLIHGAQNEMDTARRNAIRRKSAKYLVKAETLYREFLSLDGSVFNFEGLAMQDPNIIAFQCSNKTINNYKIIGILPSVSSENRVILVEDQKAKKKYVMKLIEKGSPSADSRIFLPTNIPHMVQLIQFFELEFQIVVLLEYVETGKLWNFLKRYFDEAETRYCTGLIDASGNENESFQISVAGIGQESEKAYRGRRLLFTVGVDFERVAQMRDESHSNDQPFEEAVICTMGEDAAGIADAPSGDFSIHEKLNERNEAQEEAVAEIQLNIRNEANYDYPIQLEKALRVVRHQLTLRKKSWNHLDLPECLIIHWSAQIVSFFYVLHHEHGEYIGDFNPDNILINTDGNLTISYIGKWYNTTKTPRLCEGYSAPECVKYGWKPNEKSDVWTIGAILYEMLTGRSLANAAPHGLFPNDELPIPNDSRISYAASHLLEITLKLSSTSRASLDDIRVHPFFQHIDWLLYDNPSSISPRCGDIVL